MSRCACILLCVLLALSLCINPILAGRGGYSRGGGTRHSYPSHSGLSGGGHSSGGHGYPKSGGLSGSGSSHGYPSSGGLSGSGSSHGYPNSGGMSGSSHGYPPSSVGKSGSSHGYPSSSGGMSGSGHGYPGSGGLSGSGSKYPTHTNQNHGYPASTGLAGNTHQSSGPKVTHVHHHYHYNPPQQIHYSSPGLAPMHYPVYRGTPPTYVYEYRQSGSKFSNLLAGLALFNLGALTASAFNNHRSSSSYTPKPGEICKFGIRKDNGDYEETRIKCDMITSFIWAEEAKAQSGTTGGTNSTMTTTTVTNVTTTTTNVTNAIPVPTVTQINQTMLPNGTLVPTNVTAVNITSPSNVTSSTITTSTTTVTNTTQVADALDPKNKGPPVKVTPEMICYVIRTTPTSNSKKTVSCGLLQSYAEQSLRPNSAIRTAPSFVILGAAIIAYVMH